MNLEKQIKETKELLEDYDMMPHDPGPEEIMMRNQITIMETLKEIQDEQTSPDFGTA